MNISQFLMYNSDTLQYTFEYIFRCVFQVISAHKQNYRFYFHMEIHFSIKQPPENMLYPVAANTKVKRM